MNTIHIFFTANNYYAPYLATTISSIISNLNDKYNAYFHVISNDMMEINKIKIDKLKNIRNFEIEYLSVDNAEIMQKLPKHSFASVSIDTNYRLMTANLRPNIDKAIFLDCDLVVNDDISELWNIDIDGYYAAAAPDSIAGSYIEDWWYNKFQLPNGFLYRNTGVLLINMKKWREDNIFEKFIESSIKYYDFIKITDQDIINITLSSKFKLLDSCWNYCPSLYYPDTEMEKKIKNTSKIYHYALIKAWKPVYSLSYEESKSDYRELFWKYAKMTVYYEDIIYKINIKIFWTFNIH
ncbi:glycosyltransferase family 8 protein, partial [Brachyspira intermedia]|uniref:glycosyltransferase family 8 protein n=1 Tax=Brachyspira intermedia TaxID=84377 RepID=UPI003003DA09